MQKYSLCLVLLFAAVANAAVQDRLDNNVNDVHHNFQEDIHLRGKEAELKIINLDKEEEELLGNYDDHDDNYYDEDYDEDDDDKDPDWASGDDYDDEDEGLLDDYEEEDDITLNDDKDEEEWLDDYEEEDDITLDNDKDDEDEKEWLDDYEEEDEITLDDDKDDILYDEDYDDDDDDEDGDWAPGDYYDDEDDELLDDFEKEDDKDDILYQYHAEDYEGTDDHDFSIISIAYQPPQVRAQDHGKPDKEDETVTVADLSPSSRNLLVSSVYFASGLAVLALFILAFIIYLQLYCNRHSAKEAQLPFFIQHSSDSSALHSSIIKPGRYQPVATQENKSNQSIDNDNSLFKQQTQLEEKLLPWPMKHFIITKNN